MRFTQTNVRTLKGELENQFFIFFIQSNENRFEECNLNKYGMVGGKEIR